MFQKTLSHLRTIGGGLQCVRSAFGWNWVKLWVAHPHTPLHLIVNVNPPPLSLSLHRQSPPPPSHPISPQLTAASCIKRPPLRGSLHSIKTRCKPKRLWDDSKDFTGVRSSPQTKRHVHFARVDWVTATFSWKETKLIGMSAVHSSCILCTLPREDRGTTEWTRDYLDLCDCLPECRGQSSGHCASGLLPSSLCSPWVRSCIAGA